MLLINFKKNYKKFTVLNNEFKKPNFWDKKKPNLLAYLLLPLALMKFFRSKKYQKIGK